MNLPARLVTIRCEIQNRSSVSKVMQNNIKPNWQDFYEMCKPRVVLLMLLCTLAGMFLATDDMVPLATISFCLLGVALVSGSAAALNHLVDASVDAKMARTHNRPVAQGRVSNFQGGVFVAITLALGMAILMVFINSLTAWLNLAAWAGYGIFYSVYLKRATSQNIVIGGLFGAAPPLFGWTAVTNSIDGGGLLLVLIIFVWTPPHFWALAIDRIEEYKLVEYPMLPVTHGEAYTRLQILLYTIVLVLITLLPYIIGMSNLLYLAAAVALGAGFIYWAIVMYIGKNARAPLETFRYSIVYLAGLFGALLVDHYLMPLSYV
ncbi:MAG: protoheme IX farnesyltransferase [Gammaproteobacteria bacterium]|nr:protoheme IX farnesyltransferase [Gammaproteobacteria bacterium]MBT5202801.1 protoheme IX farnesyltransferase [Gammaproteobacteria bacterium]MBT5603097.1 protoheme IX farnesyltransferase [Gammaproteobacteria bacterium]MBT6246867.1 protoheme IX farnesyltransferase [Gammaproteobacteria bacterium]